MIPMRPFDHAWTLLKHFADANGVYPPENNQGMAQPTRSPAENTMSVIGGKVMYNGQPMQPDEQGNYSAPGVNITGSSIGGGCGGDKTQQAIAMFEQVQATKRARQQQMIDAGLVPTGPAAGMQQPPPPQIPSAPDLNQMMQQQQQPM